MANETEYLSYFWWKEFYEVRESRDPSYCQLCLMLNNQVTIQWSIMSMTLVEKFKVGFMRSFLTVRVSLLRCGVT